MSQASQLLLLADTLLVIHVLFVGFVVLGLAAIYTGYFLHWRWVRNRWFRISHLAAIVIVVLQSWLGMICPLTIWEMALRERAGAAVFAGSFIQYWLHELLYWQAADWVFIVVYTVFGAMVLASWFIVRPGAKTN